MALPKGPEIDEDAKQKYEQISHEMIKINSDIVLIPTHSKLSLINYHSPKLLSVDLSPKRNLTIAYIYH